MELTVNVDVPAELTVEEVSEFVVEFFREVCLIIVVDDEDDNVIDSW